MRLESQEEIQEGEKYRKWLQNERDRWGRYCMADDEQIGRVKWTKMKAEGDERE